MKYLMLLISVVLGCHAMRSEPQAAPAASDAIVITETLPQPAKPLVATCGCEDGCKCKAGECHAPTCPTSPAEPAKQDATKQEAKPAPTNTASQLQTSVRQQINAEPRYEYRTENYGFRGRRQRTVKVLVGGGETQSAPVYYGGSMCGPNGCN